MSASFLLALAATLGSAEAQTAGAPLPLLQIDHAKAAAHPHHTTAARVARAKSADKPAHRHFVSTPPRAFTARRGLPTRAAISLAPPRSSATERLADAGAWLRGYAQARGWHHGGTRAIGRSRLGDNRAGGRHRPERYFERPPCRAGRHARSSCICRGRAEDPRSKVRDDRPRPASESGERRCDRAEAAPPLPCCSDQARRVPWVAPHGSHSCSQPSAARSLRAPLPGS